MADWMMPAVIIDGILGLLILEIAVLMIWRPRPSRRPSSVDLVFHALSGLSLAVALRIAVTGADVTIIGVALIVSGLAHGAAIWTRFAN